MPISDSCIAKKEDLENFHGRFTWRQAYPWKAIVYICWRWLFWAARGKTRRSRVKRYGCLFTCLTTHAIHIEIAHSLGTDSTVNALRRFISIRACPERIRRDPGTNLIRPDKELKEAIQGWKQQKGSSFCNQKGIEWISNPPTSMGEENTPSHVKEADSVRWSSLDING